MGETKNERNDRRDEGYSALDGVFEKALVHASGTAAHPACASVENNCNYCTEVHHTIAKAFLHAAPEIVSAIRNGMPVADKKANALIDLTREIVREGSSVSTRPSMRSSLRA